MISKKHCVARILQRIWERFLYEINLNYNFYNRSYKFTFISFLSFRRNQESNFQQVGGVVTRNNFTFGLEGVALCFKGMANSINFYKRVYLHVIPVRIIVSWFDIPVLINLFLSLTELKNIHLKHQIKEHIFLYLFI